jgi:hypothetical protein
MGMLFHDNGQPTMMVWIGIIGMLVVLFVLTLMSTIFAGQAASNSEGLVTDLTAAATGAGPAAQRFASRSDMHGREDFLGSPEPPVFYDIGSIADVRKAREGLDAGRYMSKKREGFEEEDLLKAAQGQ